LKKEIRFKSEEGTINHIFEGIENDEGQNGTIPNVNSGKGSANSGISS
jgi:hypothetical protein